MQCVKSKIHNLSSKGKDNVIAIYKRIPLKVSLDDLPCISDIYLITIR